MTERLEERELRLHRDGVRRDGVEDALAEPLDGARRAGRARANTAPDLVGQQLDPRVEADAEDAALRLGGAGESVAERLHPTGGYATRRSSPDDGNALTSIAVRGGTLARAAAMRAIVAPASGITPSAPPANASASTSETS